MEGSIWHNGQLTHLDDYGLLEAFFNKKTSSEYMRIQMEPEQWLKPQEKKKGLPLEFLTSKMSPPPTLDQITLMHSPPKWKDSRPKNGSNSKPDLILCA